MENSSTITSDFLKPADQVGFTGNLPTKTSVLVVGQGLAGSWLCYFLWKHNIDFKVVDNFHHESASTVAAGLMNPIVPKRLTATWKAEELFPDFITAAYQEIQKFIGLQVYFPDTLIHKLFYHEDDIVAWELQRNKGFDNWLGPVVRKTLNTKLKPHLGYAEIHHSAWVDIPSLIKAFQEKLKTLDLLIQEEFEYGKMIKTESGYQYKDLNFERVIFCEGSQIRNNPWFGQLPFNATKGEELLLSIPELDLEQVGYAGLHLIPFGENKYLVGSTFRWDDISSEPTDWAKEEILNKLKKVYSGPFEILEQSAGIRPASKDRRPLVGFHPKHPEIGIFNGLGTKGLLLAPLMSDYWIKHLKNNRTFEPEIHVKRLFK